MTDRIDDDTPADENTDATTGGQENGIKLSETTDDEILHFNPWRDFNDAAPQMDVFGDEPDPAQITTFMDVVFGYCEGLIPVRSFIDKG
jgi:hypothetical protein